MRMHRATLLALLVLGGCGRAATDPEPANLALQSASITLPVDTATLPAGPGHELVTTNCTSCHSVEMLTTQPPLKPEQWAATVKKMREVYKAPIAPSDDAAIVAYLGALNGYASSPASTAR